MGEVFLKYRIMPDGTEVDLDALVESVRGALPDFASLEGTETKPFAFGLKAVEARFVVADEEGNNDAVEEILQGIEGVQGVELLEMGRL